MTVHKQAEATLHESQGKLLALYELSPFGIALTDMKGRYIEFNQAFQNICGYSAEELKILDYWMLTPRKYDADEARQLESLQRIGRYGPYEKEYIRKDGSLIPLQLNGVLITGSDGQKYIWSIVQDITERKQMEEALITREQESRTMIEHSPDTIARYTPDCRRTYINPAFAAMVDGGASALLGKKPSEYPGGQNSIIYEEKLKEVFATGKNDQFELKWPDKNGREVCSHIRLTAERDLSGAIISVLGVGRDITELSEYQTELKRRELEKSRFFAAAGHDMRQPLAAASLFIDALKHIESTPQQNQIIRRLDQAMATFKGLLDSLLNISKLDSGVIKPELAPINVAEVFNWLEQNFAPMANEKQLGFKLHLPMKETLVVLSDTGLLNSVLRNLVSNAIKFTSKGAIFISARKRGGDVLFQVWDTGVGIADEHIEHIFDEFYQINNPQRDRTSGLGLGLAIAKRAMSLLGGNIACRSQLGHGTVFEFRLPSDNISRGGEPQAAALTSRRDAINLSFVQGKRFVVVEDDLLVAQALTQSLEGLGGEVKCFHNAEDALHHANTMRADCYIADYMLSSTLNGLQFLNLLRQKLGKPINATLVTGDTSTSFIREAENCDWPVLHKPVSTFKLIASLEAQGIMHD